MALLRRNNQEIDDAHEVDSNDDIPFYLGRWADIEQGFKTKMRGWANITQV